MKVVSTILLSFLVSLAGYSQSVFNNNTNSALQKVIEDYPNKFSNIKGELLAANVQTTDFDSKVRIEGSPCILTQYSSDKKPVYSWRAELLEEENFDDAKKKFKELYSQIRNTIIKIEGEKPFILNGAYQPPTEDRKFNTVMFQLLPAGRDMEKLQVELSMNFMITHWKIQLTVYEREYRDDERLTLADQE